MLIGSDQQNIKISSWHLLAVGRHRYIRSNRYELAPRITVMAGSSTLYGLLRTASLPVKLQKGPDDFLSPDDRIYISGSGWQRK